MAYIKPIYEDQDHFTCERVLEFRKHFERGASQPTERATSVTADTSQDDDLLQPTDIHGGEAGKTGQRRSPGNKEGVMNQEQFKGSWDQLKGELKKQWGKLTDDDLLQVEGDQDKFNGTIQKRYGEMKEEVSKWVDRWYARHEASIKTPSQ